MGTQIRLTQDTWNELLLHLADREALFSPEYADAAYRGTGEIHPGLAFTVPATGQFRLIAALTEAFATLDELVELSADGIGIYELLDSARADQMGLETVVYFPGTAVEG